MKFEAAAMWGVKIMALVVYAFAIHADTTTGYLRFIALMAFLVYLTLDAQRLNVSINNVRVISREDDDGEI